MTPTRSLSAFRLNHVTLFIWIDVISNVIGAALNVYGYSGFSLAAGLFSNVVFRTIWMQLVYPRVETFDCVMLCFTVSWTLSMILRVLFFLWVWRRYKKGKLRAL